MQDGKVIYIFETNFLIYLNYYRQYSEKEKVFLTDNLHIFFELMLQIFLRVFLILHTVFI